MELRLVREDEFNLAFGIIEGARAHLREQGIDQWQDGYPDSACIAKDIQIKKGYFLEDAGEVLAYMYVDIDGEPAYDDIRGSWGCDKPYAVIHRLALSVASRGKGLSYIAFSEAEKLTKKLGLDYIRVDTALDNKKMQHILTKLGYSYRGIIYYENGERLAYDKNI